MAKGLINNPNWTETADAYSESDEDEEHEITFRLRGGKPEGTFAMEG